MALIATALTRLEGDVECRLGSAQAALENHEVHVEICTEAGANFAELLIVVDGPDRLAMARLIALCLVGIPPEVWHVLPSSSGVAFHAELTVEQISAADQPAWQTAPNRPSHIVLSRMLPQALVIGTAMRALCGLVFSPTETGDATRSRDVCPMCTVVFAISTTLRGPTA